MAESTYHLGRSTEAPLRDSSLDETLCQLAAHLQLAGQTWVEWNEDAMPYLHHRILFEGAFLRIIPKTFKDKTHGHRVIVDTPELPREGYFLAEHVFDGAWNPMPDGRVQIHDAGETHTYWLRREEDHYQVNAPDELLEKDTERLHHVTGLLAVHAAVVVETMHEPYYCG